MLAAALLLTLSQGLYGPAQTPKFKTDRRMFDLGKLPVAVTWPKGASGKLPVVVWSHGMYGSRTTYKPVYETLAGAAYVVIQPTHGDSVDFMTQEQRRKLLANPNTNATQSWAERPGEVSKCIDSLSEIEKRIPELAGKLDADRVAVGGHSFGAWTTQALAGMELSAVGRSRNFGDDRIKAFVVLSGTGPGGGVQEASLKKMRGPMMFLTGTNDTARKGDTGEWRAKAFELASPGDKWLVWIDGATHNFGGITGGPPALQQFLRRAGSSADNSPKHKDIVLSSILSFLDAYVGRSPSAMSYLKTKKIETLGGVSVKSK